MQVFFFQAEDGIRDSSVTGVQTCALPISEQARAFGVYSFVASAGASIGLLAGGILTHAISWHWIFFVNVPIGIVSIALSVRLIDSDRGIGLRSGADVIGPAPRTAALTLPVHTILRTSP